MPAETIDFRIERGRHEHFFGRQDVLAAIDEHLAGAGAASGWVLVAGGPGMGKSAILSRWLDLQEQRGRKAPHHFLRRDVMDWDRPEAVVRSLAAQIEELYPAQRDPQARPDSRLWELLGRVSQHELVPRGERLVLVIDGLDEARGDGAAHNPLPSFLPYVLPPGVHVLGALRPQYPHLPWLEARGNVRRIDLDEPAWSGSNDEACRGFWAYHAPRFATPLDGKLVAEAVARGQGNLLYAVMLREWLEVQPVERRRVELLPRGLTGFLEQIWEQLLRLPGERFGLVADGLGVICAAREALPVEEIEAAAGWKDIRAKESFLQAARALLLEEPEQWRGVRAYRPYHESFREFIAQKVGSKRMAEQHRRLLGTTARWPVEAETDGGDFRRRYAPRHAIAHAIAAGEREAARGLCRDVELLEALCREGGTAALEGALREAAKELGDEEIALIHRAVMAESHWLPQEPEALPGLLYSRLRSAGWEARRIDAALRFPAGRPMLRLRHPVRMWNGEERTLSGHSAIVSGCAISPDGQRIVSASFDKTLKIWDLATGQLVSTLQGHSDLINACAISPDGQRIVSASDDRTLKVWDLATGQLVNTLRGHTGNVKACAISLDGERIISASFETVKVWDPATGQIVAALQDHTGDVKACGISLDGQRIVCASDGTLNIWDIASRQLVSSLQGHSGEVLCCAISPDGQRIVSGSADKTLKVWDLATYRFVSTLQGHSGEVTGCAISLDGQRVVSASADSTLRVWDLSTGRVVSTFWGHSYWVSACAISPDGQHIVSASDDKTLKVWDLATGQLSSSLEVHSDWVAACAISPDGQRIVSASYDGTLKIWDVTTGQPISTLEGHSDKVRDCAIIADGQRIVSASSDGTLKVWDLATGQLVSTLNGHSIGVSACAVSPDSKYVVSASWGGKLKVMDLATSKLIFTIDGHSASVLACAISPDGQRIVSASVDKTLKVWDLATGRRICTLKGHSDCVTACAISPDGQHMVSASDDKTIKIWDLVTRRLVSTLEGHSDEICACAISPDGQRIISASSDRTIRIWDLVTMKCLTVVHGISLFRCVAMSNRLICAGDAVGSLWFLEPNFPSVTKQDRSTPRPIRLFFSYAHKDEALRDALETHLAPLKRDGVLQSWHEGRIAPGEAWADEIDRNLAEADVILLLVSADFLASDFCYEQQMKRALERHHAGQARVIPVILRPADWTRAPFAKLDALPKDARPVTRWEDRDEAWTDVAAGIRRAVEALRSRAGT